jgi:enterobacteria phage integrase
MSYAHIDGDTIEVAQQKTGQENADEKLVIPMHRNLRRELVLAKREHVVILTTAFGQPFSLKGFGNFVSDAIRAAELPARCKAHGLRKAAARRLAEAGCTAKQIQAITGHKSLEEVERYTRKADQRHLARQAVAKQENNGGS